MKTKIVASFRPFFVHLFNKQMFIACFWNLNLIFRIKNFVHTTTELNEKQKINRNFNILMQAKLYDLVSTEITMKTIQMNSKFESILNEKNVIAILRAAKNPRNRSIEWQSNQNRNHFNESCRSCIIKYRCSKYTH